jgi:hypothetical protein
MNINPVPSQTLTSDSAIKEEFSVTLSETPPQGDDPDMEGREGVPPNSVGSGTR